MAYHLQTLVPQSVIGDDASAAFATASGGMSPEAGSVILLVAIAAASLLLAMQSVERREFVLEQ